MLLDAAVAALGGVDILVNNAGGGVIRLNMKTCLVRTPCLKGVTLGHGAAEVPSERSQPLGLRQGCQAHRPSRDVHRLERVVVEVLRIYVTVQMRAAVSHDQEVKFHRSELQCDCVAHGGNVVPEGCAREASSSCNSQTWSFRMTTAYPGWVWLLVQTRIARTHRDDQIAVRIGRQMSVQTHWTLLAGSHAPPVLLREPDDQPTLGGERVGAKQTRAATDRSPLRLPGDDA